MPSFHCVEIIVPFSGATFLNVQQVSIFFLQMFLTSYAEATICRKVTLFKILFWIKKKSNTPELLSYTVVCTSFTIDKWILIRHGDFIYLNAELCILVSILLAVFSIKEVDWYTSKALDLYFGSYLHPATRLFNHIFLQQVSATPC
jgi:hypothetical protein